MVPMSVMVADYSKDLTGLAPDDIDGICSLYPVGQLERCPTRPCPSGYACMEGNCLWDSKGAPPFCMVDGDCAAAERCEASLCVEGTRSCAVDRDCASSEQRCVGGRCMIVVDPPAPMCTSNPDCAADEVCKAGLCVAADPAQPVGLPVGSDCAMDSDCESGLCRVTADATHCTAFCSSDADCRTVERCLHEGAQTGLCGPLAHVSGSQAQTAAEGRRDAAATGCSSTQSSSTTALGWLIAAAWLLRARFCSPRRKSNTVRPW